MKKFSLLFLFLSQFAFAGIAHPILAELVSYDPNNVIGNKEKATVYQSMQELQDFYQGVSYGAVNIQFDLAGPFVLPKPSACDPHGDGDHADALASGSGQHYRHHLYAYADRNSSDFLQKNCKWVGLGSYGGPTTRAWIAYHDSGWRLYAHEFGHNLGLHHAASDNPTHNCQPGRTTTVTRRGETVFQEEAGSSPLASAVCSEYGDPTDVLGHGPSVNAPHRVQAGWLPSTPISKSGTYTVGALDTQFAQILTFPKADTMDDYYLSSTQDGKLHVHRWKTGQLSQTIHMASLAEGEEFEDEVNGVSLYVPSEGSVEINFEGQAKCKRVGLYPLGINPGYQYGVPGGHNTVQVRVKNRDSKECKPTTFKLSGKVPDGVSYKFPVDEVTLKPNEEKWLNWEIDLDPQVAKGQKLLWVYVKGVVEAQNGFSTAVVEVK